MAVVNVPRGTLYGRSVPKEIPAYRWVCPVLRSVSSASAALDTAAPVTGAWDSSAAENGTSSQPATPVAPEAPAGLAKTVANDPNL